MKPCFFQDDRGEPGFGQSFRVLRPNHKNRKALTPRSLSRFQGYIGRKGRRARTIRSPDLEGCGILKLKAEAATLGFGALELNSVHHQISANPGLLTDPQKPSSTVPVAPCSRKPDASRFLDCSNFRTISSRSRSSGSGARTGRGNRSIRSRSRSYNQ